LIAHEILYQKSFELDFIRRRVQSQIAHKVRN
jgi:hypothetical protein